MITTSGYGPASEEFANGKPLHLIDGPGLISICQEHGIPARILGSARASPDHEPARRISMNNAEHRRPAVEFSLMRSRIIRIAPSARCSCTNPAQDGGARRDHLIRLSSGGPCPLTRGRARSIHAVHRTTIVITISRALGAIEQ